MKEAIFHKGTPPAEVLNAIEQWMDLSTNYRYGKRVKALNPRFQSLTADIACWADSGGCNVDPSPLIDYLQMVERQCGIDNSAVGSNATAPTVDELKEALNCAFVACQRMMNVAIRQADPEGTRQTVMVYKSELCKMLDCGESAMRKWLDEKVASGEAIEAEGKRRSKKVLLDAALFESLANG